MALSLAVILAGLWTAVTVDATHCPGNAFISIHLVACQYWGFSGIKITFIHRRWSWYIIRYTYHSQFVPTCHTHTTVDSENMLKSKTMIGNTKYTFLFNRWYELISIIQGWMHEIIRLFYILYYPKNCYWFNQSSVLADVFGIIVLIVQRFLWLKVSASIAFKLQQSGSFDKQGKFISYPIIIIR